MVTGSDEANGPAKVEHKKAFCLLSQRPLSLHGKVVSFGSLKPNWSCRQAKRGTPRERIGLGERALPSVLYHSFRMRTRRRRQSTWGLDACQPLATPAMPFLPVRNRDRASKPLQSSVCPCLFPSFPFFFVATHVCKKAASNTVILNFLCILFVFLPSSFSNSWKTMGPPPHVEMHVLFF